MGLQIGEPLWEVPCPTWNHGDGVEEKGTRGGDRMGGVHVVGACEDDKTSCDAASVGVGCYDDDDCGRGRDP